MNEMSGKVFFDLFTPKMKTLRSFKTSATTYKSARYRNNIPEDAKFSRKEDSTYSTRAGEPFG